MKKIIVLLIMVLLTCGMVGALPTATANAQVSLILKTSDLEDSATAGFQSTLPNKNSHTHDYVEADLHTLTSAEFYPWIHYKGMKTSITAKLKGAPLKNSDSYLPYSVTGGKVSLSVADTAQETALELGSKDGIDLFWTEGVTVAVTSTTGIIAGTYKGSLTLEIEAI